MGPILRGSLAARVALLAPLLAALQGCGLETTVPVLNEPDGTGDMSPPTLFITTATEWEPRVANFITNYGLELYYRFYPDLSSVNSTLSTHSDLVANRFRRMTVAFPGASEKPPDKRSLEGRPLLDLDHRTPSSVILEFAPVQVPSTGEPKITKDSAPLPWHVGRGVPKSELPDSLFKTFRDDYEVGDADLDLMPQESGPREAYLAVYALSYAQWELTTTIYSRAVFLQKLRVSIEVRSR